VRRFVWRVGPGTLDALFALREGDVVGRGFGEDPERELGELLRRIGDVAAADAALHVTDLAIDGQDVMRVLGIPPGREIGELLEPHRLANGIDPPLAQRRSRRRRRHARDVVERPAERCGDRRVEVPPRRSLAVVDATHGDAVVRLGALLHDVGKPRARQPREGAPGEYSFFKHEYVGKDMADAICRRWKLSTADRSRVVSMVEHHMFYYTPDWTDGTVRRFVRRVGSDTLDALFALREGDVVGRGFDEDPEREIGEMRRRIAELTAADAALHVTDLKVDSEDVMRVAGIPPSREIREILERLLELVLDDQSLNTREKLLELIPTVRKKKD